ncbi:MAG: TIGR00730 family Rossman fold protein [Acidimicrobiaceae bacterium]|nr:TIGR00730 family Rossman fold protein [Acidimicrobiaceae bacterium]
MASLCVFCGANPGNDPAIVETATELGRTIAEHGHRLVYGGGRVGLMGTVADAALAAGGDVAGFIPKALADREVAHTGLTDLVITDTMHTRKQAMCDASDGVIALPGGYGTLDEVIEILTWNQIGTVAMPVAFLDVNGYFDSLFRFFDECVEAGLIMPAHRSMAQRAESVEAALAIATGPVPASPSKWTDPTVR